MPIRGCHAVPYECLNMGHNLKWERTWISLSSKLDSRVVQYFKSTLHERIQNVFGRIVFHEHKRANVKIIKKIWNNFSLTLSNRYFFVFMEFPQDYLLWLYEANRRTCVASGSYKNKYRAQWCGGGMNICSRYQETRAYLLAASAKMRWFECQDTEKSRWDVRLGSECVFEELTKNLIWKKMALKKTNWRYILKNMSWPKLTSNFLYT